MNSSLNIRARGNEGNLTEPQLWLRVKSSLPLSGKENLKSSDIAAACSTLQHSVTYRIRQLLYGQHVLAAYGTSHFTENLLLKNSSILMKMSEKEPANGKQNNSLECREETSHMERKAEKNENFSFLSVGFPTRQNGDRPGRTFHGRKNKQGKGKAT